MGDLSWDRIEAIIDKALSLPEHKRRKFIDYECEGNDDLKAEVTLMMDSITASEGWLENPSDYKEMFYDELSEDVEQLQAAGSLIGEKVGAYTIREELGAGGMGSVYRAERTDGEFEHEVAIKVIRHGHATAENIRRFERERNILAGLNHPGIAHLFGGGITDDGFPYLIMECVRGQEIDEYCDKKRCTVEERLQLFVQVIEAVRHAHENMVIHRDLKPSNIMVTPEGVVKILDFGISKILEEEADVEITQTKTRILTPRFAAPEQILHKPVTMATDMYTLGVLLYQMLSGQYPYDMADMSLHEAEGVVLNGSAPPPSKKVTTDAAEKRKTTVTALRKNIRGDLDAIVNKAMRKEPEARYRTANDFLNDIKNYQRNEPVSAHADTWSYRFGKLYRRHKKSLVATAVFLVLLISMSVFYTWRITQERNQANFEARKSKQVKEFLVSLFQQADPFTRDSSDPVTVKEVLERGTDRVQSILKDQPALQADMLATLAQVYMNLGSYPEAEKLARQALDIDAGNNGPLFKVSTLQNLASAMAWQGRYEKADSLFNLALNIYHQTDQKDSLVISGLYNNWGFILQEQGADAESKEMLLKSINLEAKSHRVRYSDAVTLHNLAASYNSLGRLDSAIYYYRKALNMEEKVVGNEHPMVANTMSLLGAAYFKAGDLVKAESLQQASLVIRENVLPAGHPHIGASQVRLARILVREGQPQKADSLLVSAISTLRKHFPENHWRLVAAKGILAVSRAFQGRFDEAEEPLKHAFMLYKKQFGLDDWRTQEAVKALAMMYKKWGKIDSARYYMGMLQAGK